MRVYGRVCVCVCEGEPTIRIYFYERFPFFVRCTFRFFIIRVMTNFAGLILFFYDIILFSALYLRAIKNSGRGQVAHFSFHTRGREENTYSRCIVYYYSLIKYYIYVAR